MGEIVKAVNLSKKNSEGFILKEINFSIEEGDFVLLCGDLYGAKSFMGILSGTGRASSGKLFVYNDDITKFDDKRLNEYRHRCVGYISKKFDFVNNLSLKDNIMLVSGNARAADMILEETGLIKKANTFPSSLSREEYKTAMLARAMAKSPVLLLCDEPTFGLDKDQAAFVMEKIRRIHRENQLTVIVTTLEPNFSADKVFRFKDGSIE